MKLENSSSICHILVKIRPVNETYEVIDFFHWKANSMMQCFSSGMPGPCSFACFLACLICQCVRGSYGSWYFISFSAGNLFAYRLRICSFVLLEGASLYAVISAASSLLISSFGSMGSDGKAREINHPLHSVLLPHRQQGNLAKLFPGIFTVNLGGVFPCSL